MADIGLAELDDRFADCTILPGFVEGHSHLHEGAAWRDPYLGYFDRRAPDGQVVAGLRSIDAVIARLRQLATATNGALTAWGFDPIYFRSRRMVRADLDAVTPDRPVVITHASGHIMNVNTTRAGAGRLLATTATSTVCCATPAGDLTGELLGPER